MRIIRFADLIETPWKNGGGVTRNIAEDRRDGALRWRLSMADVDVDGPFSDFTGLTRILTVVAGAGMVLSGPDGDVAADYAVPVVFDGATPITSTLKDGPLRDLNLMFDPTRCEGAVSPLRGPLTQDIHADGIVGVHCMSGDIRVNAETLVAGDTALAHEDLAVEMGEGSHALLITVRDVGRGSA